MKKIMLALILLSGIFSGAALAAKLNRIELVDGSVIIGEISGVNNGTYTVNSQGMGFLQIEESRIKQIGSADSRNSPSFPQPQPDGSVQNKADAMTNKMMGDPATVGMVMSLQDDPQLQEILQDPEIMEAIKSGNSASLANNEKFMRLKNNPKIQAIKERIE
ncbi:MAG: hypothetical protein PHW54_04445 [Candidatus Omnitrophica bacterium]|nr:hypothetical protein [Candidatus Omnitrophota bacterium]